MGKHSESQRIAYKSGFSSSSLEVPGIKFRQSGFAASPFPAEPSHQPFRLYFKMSCLGTLVFSG